MNIPAFLTYSVIMTMTPGPNNLMCLYLGAKGGFRAFWRFCVGSMGALCAKCVLCGFLNLLLAEKIPALVPYLKWLGALYMLYLAFNMVRSSIKNADDKAGNGEGTVRGGILLQVLNIKSWVAALSLFSVYVIPYTAAPGAILLSSLTFAVMGTAASTLWCAFGTAIQSLYRRFRLPVSIALAATLVLCAWSAVK
mgnify:FL=1